MPKNNSSLTTTIQSDREDILYLPFFIHPVLPEKRNRMNHGVDLKTKPGILKPL
jgi:hypothetical protein